jgi:hypothetical protein
MSAFGGKADIVWTSDKADMSGLSDPVDARSVAPRRSEMDVQVLCFHIRELALYRRFDVSAFDDLPVRHHPRSIKAAHGECAAAARRRSMPLPRTVPSGGSPMGRAPAASVLAMPSLATS